MHFLCLRPSGSQEEFCFPLGLTPCLSWSKEATKEVKKQVGGLASALPLLVFQREVLAVVEVKSIALSFLVGWVGVAPYM